MSGSSQKLEAVIFDWAGTLVDYGSCVPAITFQRIFDKHGVSITLEQAREPMGQSKRDHIVSIASIADVKSAWHAHHGRLMTETDIDAMYQDFIPIQLDALRATCDVIPGIADAVEWCRRRGLRLGSSTGYTRELMEAVLPQAKAQGLEVETVVCADDVAEGRPAPDMIQEAVRRLAVSDVARVVNVDDTAVGVEAARRAGCWSVGVSKTGNGVGLSLDEMARLPEAVIKERTQRAADSLAEAGAHFVIESVAHIKDVITEIEAT